MKRIILFVAACLIGVATLKAQIKPLIYEISAGNIDLKAADTYPQKVLKVLEHNDTLVRIELSAFPPVTDSAQYALTKTAPYLPGYAWPDSVARYLEPTALIQSGDPRIKAIADTLFTGDETLAIDVIRKALEFSKNHLTFDQSLAMELGAGRCTTLPVDSILDRRKGTCSEYTNLFIALMRHKGIPTRMAVGYIYMPQHNIEGSHAWAECYLKNYGWFTVDPQNAVLWFPPGVIKLFHGTDFIDCNIPTLPDMYPVNVMIIDPQ